MKHLSSLVLVILFSLMVVVPIARCNDGPSVGGDIPSVPGGLPSVPADVPSVPGGLPDPTKVNSGLSALPGLPLTLLELALKADININLSCKDTCLCLPPACTPKLDLISADALLSLLQFPNLPENLLNGCPNLKVLVLDACLAKVGWCYKKCGETSQTCNTLLGVCLKAGVSITLLNPLNPQCSKEALLKVLLEASVDVDLCALFLEAKQANCKNCLVVGKK